jgi:AcrR family transcriptional regulator
MRYSREHKLETHARIVKKASVRLREKGAHGVGVADLMKEAGLTHGGFYAHFDSRDALVIEAFGYAMDRGTERWRKVMEQIPPEKRFSTIVESYLTPLHRDDPGNGCAIPTLGAEIARRTITLMAPSKTYNLPGFGTSLAIIPDAALRAQFVRATTGMVAEVNCLGYTACAAAYRHGEPWRQALLAYLRGNREHLLACAARDLPGLRVEAPIEATYLAWCNIAALGLKDPVAHFEKHGVGLSDGRPFGARPGTYLRLNFGCPRATLAEALARMKQAVAAR